MLRHIARAQTHAPHYQISDPGVVLYPLRLVALHHSNDDSILVIPVTVARNGLPIKPTTVRPSTLLSGATLTIFHEGAFPANASFHALHVHSAALPTSISVFCWEEFLQSQCDGNEEVNALSWTASTSFNAELLAESRQVFAAPSHEIELPSVTNLMRSTFVQTPARTRPVPDDVVTRVPLIRKRERMPAANSLAELAAWSVERRLLAEMAGNTVSENDIQVIAVFRRIPVGCASAVEIGPGSSNLSIYLRLNRRKVVQSGVRPMLSIAFGRVKGQKKVIRAVVPS